jgi:hypothetical protein
LLSQQGQRLRLAGLAPADLRPLASTLCGLELSPAVRERLCEHTGGNPLYVRALLEELPASALADARSPLPAPHSYAATVITRMARLSDAAQNLLGAGSVIGQHFSLPVAAQVAGVHDAVASLDEACAARLLTSAMRAGEVEAAFTHPLVRYRWAIEWQPHREPMMNWPPSWWPRPRATSPLGHCRTRPSTFYLRRSSLPAVLAARTVC